MENKAIIETKGLCKNYGGVQALKDVSVAFQPGLVHALMGENGAGKSTFIKILSGIERPSSGQILINGEKVDIHTPIRAHQLGISTVYQEPMQVASVSIAENIFAGRLPKTALGFVDYRKLHRMTAELMESIGFSEDPDTLLSELNVAQRQIVEILKSLSFDSKIVIFDEPTSSLTKEETGILFAIIRQLREKGVTVLYVSHRLEEVYQLSDTVTVLRDGVYIGQSPTAETSQQQLIESMVGRNLENLFPKKQVEIGPPVLRAQNLSNSYVRDVSFTLHRGEVLGFCGLVGAGRSEMARSLFGIDAYTGDILLEETPVRINTPWKAIELGIAMVPEDRKVEGLVRQLSVLDNISVVSMKKHSTLGLLHTKTIRRQAREMVDRLSIRTPSADQLVDNLSGGNQQKVVFAKWLNLNPRVLILDEPTRGVDIGAKAEIYTIISELVEAGIAVIMISSEMPELIAMSDRIVVMHQGTVAGEVAREDFSESRLMEMALKGKNMEAS